MNKTVSRPVLIVSVVISLIALLLMLLPAGKVPENRPPMPDLSHFTPAQIGPWIMLSHRRYTEEELDALIEEDTYSQTYEAIYLGSNNNHIYLSLSYGENQLDGKVHAHRPEYCYQAQGYDISNIKDEYLSTPKSEIPIRLLKAEKPKRTEYITYWMTLSNHAVIPGWSRMLAQIGYGLKGEIPDGLLVRISTISQDPESAYAEQKLFVQKWLESLPEELSFRLTGL